MKWNRLGTLALVVAVVGVLVAPAVASAENDTTEQWYSRWKAQYDGWTQEDVEAAGYQVTPDCVSAEAEGLPAELGAMGYHAIKPELLMDSVVDPAQPEVILLDAEGDVIGIEWEIPELIEPAPTIGGLEMDYTPPHPGVDEPHLSKHVYFVGPQENRFTMWNPGVSCPEGADDSRAELHGGDEHGALASDSGGDGERADASAPAGVDDAEGDEAEALPASSDDGGEPESAGGGAAAGGAYTTEASSPRGMPLAGAGDAIPGGGTTLLLIAAAVMAGVAMVGRTVANR